MDSERGKPGLKEFKAVSIIIPAVNETYLLRETVEIIERTCDARDIAEMIIVLCEKSTPACAETAQKVRDDSRFPNITVYYQKEPYLGAAYKEPFGFAQGSHIIIMSADRETDPYLVKDFIAVQKKYPDAVIIASRWIKGGSFSGYNRVKLVCNFVFGRMLSVLYFSRLTDMACGYKSLPADLARAVAWQETRHPLFLEIALKPLRLGVDIREIPFQWKPRTQGESQNAFFQNFKYFKTALVNRFMKKSRMIKTGVTYKGIPGAAGAGTED